MSGIVDAIVSGSKWTKDKTVAIITDQGLSGQVARAVIITAVSAKATAVVAKACDCSQADANLIGKLRVYNGNLSSCPSKEAIDRILLNHRGLWHEVNVPYKKCYGGSLDD